MDRMIDPTLGLLTSRRKVFAWNVVLIGPTYTGTCRLQTIPPVSIRMEMITDDQWDDLATNCIISISKRENILLELRGTLQIRSCQTRIKWYVNIGPMKAHEWHDVCKCLLKNSCKVWKIQCPNFPWEWVTNHEMLEC